jgi:hypothetical protein
MAHFRPKFILFQKNGVVHTRVPIPACVLLPLCTLAYSEPPPLRYTHPPAPGDLACVGERCYSYACWRPFSLFGFPSYSALQGQGQSGPPGPGGDGDKPVRAAHPFFLHPFCNVRHQTNSSTHTNRLPQGSLLIGVRWELCPSYQLHRPPGRAVQVLASFLFLVFHDVKRSLVWWRERGTPLQPRLTGVSRCSSSAAFPPLSPHTC